MTKSFGPQVLRLANAEMAIDQITEGMRREVRGFRRKGGVLGLSGGIDSSVVAALAARAFGADNVLGLLMPEADSSPDTLRLSRLAAEAAGIPTALEVITPILEAFGCYQRRDEAFARVVPEFGPGWKAKIVLPSVIESDAFRLFSVVALAPDGRSIKERLPLEEYLQVVAATNFKQ
ncbi:MAG TPA: asparagine synthase-related protein, partial [Trueperaceae bacterium]|nr:asparagine synthase-related protein [Trueperaceae bacterium]